MRREILELALYTFKYVDDVTQVVAFMPPRPDAQAASSVYLQKSDVAGPAAPAAAQRRSCPATRRHSGRSHDDELGKIDRLTRPRTFEYEFQQTQEGSAILVLTPSSSGRTCSRPPGGARPGEGQARHALALPAAGADRGRARTRRSLVLPAPRPAPLPRLRADPERSCSGAADASDDLVTHELCHVWQMQHRPVHMVATYLTKRYRENPYEREGTARRRREPLGKQGRLRELRCGHGHFHRERRAPSAARRGARPAAATAAEARALPA